MNSDGAVNQELLGNFQLLCDLISPSRTPFLQVDLSKLEDIIHKQIPNAMGKNAPPDYYELYVNFKAEYDKFRDYILYDRLIGKNVVALGGGFSSGKSSFLNALTGEPALPEAIEPTTAVPTYVVHGDGYCVQAINIFDAKVTFSHLLDIQKVAHGFGKLEVDGETVSNGTTLGHILESLFLATPRQVYQNIAFLDTPGYSKPDSGQYSARTDEQIARQQLNTAGLILWFVNAEDGIIKKNDIDFLKSLREEIPKLVIVTRADRRADQLAPIMDKIRQTIALKGVRSCLGVYAYDKECPGEYDLEEIRAFLANWNQRTAEPNFAVNFKKLFVRCRKYFEDEKQKTGWQLSQLNRASMILASSGENAAGEVLNKLMEDLRRESAALTEAGEAVQALQDEFFQEIKRIGGVVGIRMPEPSEIDLLQENASDPLLLLKAYNRAKGIKSDPQLRSILRRTFENVQPVMGQLAGGSAYQKRLVDILQKNCRVEPEKVRFNDVYRRTEEYKRLVGKLPSPAAE